MHCLPQSRPVDRVTCRHHMSGDLLFSDLTVETASRVVPGQSGHGPSVAARRLASLYFSSLPRLSWGLARVRTGAAEPDGQDSGAQTELCLSLAPFFPLIVLGPPRTAGEPAKATVTYPVIGGLLSRRPSTGALTFEVAIGAGRATLAVRVREFSSRLAGDCSSLWRRALYRGTQWLLHRILVIRFLRRAGRDFAGSPW